MDSASFKIDRLGFAKAFPPPNSVAAEITGNQELVDRKADSFVVLGHYKVTVKGTNGSEAVELSCTISALFSLDKEVEEAHLERFTQTEVRLVFWPYLRHFVSDSTYRMAISPLILPLTSEVPTAQR
jgi:preprotein translocase subunit SecB